MPVTPATMNPRQKFMVVGMLVEVQKCLTDARNKLIEAESHVPASSPVRENLRRVYGVLYADTVQFKGSNGRAWQLWDNLELL